MYFFVGTSHAIRYPQQAGKSLPTLLPLTAPATFVRALVLDPADFLSAFRLGGMILLRAFLCGESLHSLIVPNNVKRELAEKSSLRGCERRDTFFHRDHVVVGLAEVHKSESRFALARLNDQKLI